MARIASGKELLEQAKDSLVNSRTIEKLQQAQAVMLSLEFSLSMKQTVAVGRCQRTFRPSTLFKCASSDQIVQLPN